MSSPHSSVSPVKSMRQQENNGKPSVSQQAVLCGAALGNWESWSIWLEAVLSRPMRRRRTVMQQHWYPCSIKTDLYLRAVQEVFECKETEIFKPCEDIVSPRLLLELPGLGWRSAEQVVVSRGAVRWGHGVEKQCSNPFRRKSALLLFQAHVSPEKNG